MERPSRLLPARSRRGQILIPFFFVIPSLFLFVFIIFETAKLSREKIRHQFAVDSAAFIEMTNYSDFLNRSAYVNGAFPERIFHESFWASPCLESKHTKIGSSDVTQIGCGGSSKGNLFKILYKNSAFPARESLKDSSLLSPDSEDGGKRWKINFYDGDKNAIPPQSKPCPLGPGGEGQGNCAYIITGQDALDFWIQWEDAQDVYKLYFQIYQLLGSVYEAQLAVFNRLTKEAVPHPHTFYRKSVWLNTGETGGEHDEFARRAVENSFRDRVDAKFTPQAHCVQWILFYGNQYTPTAYQLYKIYSPETAVRVKSLSKCDGDDGLFQVAYTKGDLAGIFNSKLSDKDRVAPAYGVPIEQVWSAPLNYWNVPFNTIPEAKCHSSDGGPCVRASISLLTGGTEGGSLWPDPTPKFQTRLFP